MNRIYLLNDDKYDDAINLPMIKINFFQKRIDLEPFDALIFTSKNGVRAINKIDKNWIHKEIYSIGQGTSKEIKKFRANLVYTARSSYGDTFALEIREKLKNKKVLFLRAKEVTSKLNKILIEADIELYEEIVYETTCRVYKDEVFLKKNSTIIFTSPTTVKCFFKNFKWDKSYKAVSIGSVTANFVPDYVDNTVSQKQTIANCIKLAKSI